MEQLFRVVKASERRPPKETKERFLIFNGQMQIGGSLAHNTALWSNLLEDWIYDWQFENLFWLEPVAAIEDDKEWMKDAEHEAWMKSNHYGDHSEAFRDGFYAGAYATRTQQDKQLEKENEELRKENEELRGKILDWATGLM